MGHFPMALFHPGPLYLYLNALRDLPLGDVVQPLEGLGDFSGANDSCPIPIGSIMLEAQTEENICFLMCSVKLTCHPTCLGKMLAPDIYAV